MARGVFSSGAFAKSIVAAAVHSVISVAGGGGGGASCAFPFNASQATIQGYGFTDRLTLSNADQTFVYTTQGSLGATQVWAAGPAVTGTLDASTGITAMEWNLDHEPVLTGGAVGDAIQQLLVFFTGAFAEALKINVSYTPSGKSVGITLGGVSVFSGSPTVSRFGVEFNATAGAVRIKVDGGIELLLSSNTYTPQAFTPLAQVAEDAGLSVGFAGQTVGSSFVSDAASYVYGYTTGAVDLCGNAVTAPASPASLFAASEKGWWYDISDLSTLFQDNAFSTRVAALGDPVGGVLDKSGNGLHLTASGTARPLLQQDATTGFYYLDFDGIDDKLRTAVASLGAPTYCMSVIGLKALGATQPGPTGYAYSYGDPGAASGNFSSAFTKADGHYEEYLTGPTDIAAFANGVNVDAAKEIFTLLGDLSAGGTQSLALRLRENLGVEGGATAGAAPGVGTFTNMRASLGERASYTAAMYAGRVYGWVARFASSNTTEQDATINYINDRMGAF